MDMIDEIAVLRDYANFVFGEHFRYIIANKLEEDMSDPLFQNEKTAFRISQDEVYLCETMDDIDRLRKQLHQLHDYFTTNYGNK